MRIFISVLILILGFQSMVKADDIKDFEIEGISVGDNLLNHAETIGVTKQFIKDRRFTFYPASKRLGLLAFKDEGNYNT